MLKYVLALGLLALAVIAVEEHLFEHELQLNERLTIKFVPSKRFSFEFLTKSNDIVFSLMCSDGKTIRFIREKEEPIIKDVGLEVGKPLELSFFISEEGVKVQREGELVVEFKTEIPLTKVVAIKSTGLDELPEYSAVL